jgi:hypothetical protein
MKRSLLLALLGSLSLFACAADSTPDEPTEKVSEAKSDLAVLDSSKYCLPGEVVKCTLGPPPVCHCESVTKTTTTLYAR